MNKAFIFLVFLMTACPSDPPGSLVDGSTPYAPPAVGVFDNNYVEGTTEMCVQEDPCDCFYQYSGEKVFSCLSDMLQDHNICSYGDSYLIRFWCKGPEGNWRKERGLVRPCE